MTEGSENLKSKSSTDDKKLRTRHHDSADNVEPTNTNILDVGLSSGPQLTIGSVLGRGDTTIFFLMEADCSRQSSPNPIFIACRTHRIARCAYP